MSTLANGDFSRVRKLLGSFIRMLQKQEGYEGTPWAESILPQSGSVYVLADGYLSKSVATKTYSPWLNDAKPRITTACPNASICGFSYLGPNRHYGPSNTDVSVRNAALSLFQPYAPNSQPEPLLSYIGFSLGGSLMSLGLGNYLKADSFPSSAGQLSVPALILIEPGLVLGHDYRETIKKMRGQQTSVVLEEFARLGPLIREEIVMSLRTIVAQGIQVHLIYWEGDNFVVYPHEVTDTLYAIGVRLWPFTPTNNSPSDNHLVQFDQHRLIARDEKMLVELEKVLLAIRSKVPLAC